MEQSTLITEAQKVALVSMITDGGSEDIKSVAVLGLDVLDTCRDLDEI